MYDKLLSSRLILLKCLFFGLCALVWHLLDQSALFLKCSVIVQLRGALCALFRLVNKPTGLFHTFLFSNGMEGGTMWGLTFQFLLPPCFESVKKFLHPAEVDIEWCTSYQ